MGVRECSYQKPIGLVRRSCLDQGWTDELEARTRSKGGRNAMKIALGTDHAGYRLKEAVKAHLEAKGVETIDYGTDSEDSVDYPDYIRPAANAVADGTVDFAIVFGGSGNGEAIVANKVPGVRCGLCWNTWSARLTKEHNDANVIALGGRVVSIEEAVEIVDTWLNADFEGGRHIARVSKIELAIPR